MLLNNPSAAYLVRVTNSLSKPKYWQEVKLLSVTFTLKAVTILVQCPVLRGKCLLILLVWSLLYPSERPLRVYKKKKKLS